MKAAKRSIALLKRHDYGGERSEVFFEGAGFVRAAAEFKNEGRRSGELQSKRFAVRARSGRAFSGDHCQTHSCSSIFIPALVFCTERIAAGCELLRAACPTCNQIFNRAFANFGMSRRMPFASWHCRGVNGMV